MDTASLRQVVLDTETTGLETRDGHRIIEIGAVELVDRRLTGNNFHFYLNPDRLIDPEAMEVHGITDEFVADKPRFADLAGQFIDYIRDAELIIHNAPFDVGFLDHEFGLLDPSPGLVADYSRVLDSLDMARDKHPGMRNSLDALCRRYDVDNSSRDLHGALLDARLLAEVYLRMTGGQTRLSLDMDAAADGTGPAALDLQGPREILVRPASANELGAHEERLAAIDGKAADGCLWLRPAAGSG
ncbi:MAG: DNA polymerase III subunit epsilon [Pseudomonadota bacterium]